MINIRFIIGALIMVLFSCCSCHNAPNIDNGNYVLTETIESQLISNTETAQVSTEEYLNKHPSPTEAPSITATPNFESLIIKYQLPLDREYAIQSINGTDYFVDQFNMVPKLVEERNNDWRKLDYENYEDAEIMYGNIVKKGLPFISSNGIVISAGDRDFREILPTYLGETEIEKININGKEYSVIFLLLGLRDLNENLHILKVAVDAEELSTPHGIYFNCTFANSVDGSITTTGDYLAFNSLISQLKIGTQIVVGIQEKEGIVIPKFSPASIGDKFNANNLNQIFTAKLFNTHPELHLSSQEKKGLERGEWPDRLVKLVFTEILNINVTSEDQCLKRKPASENSFQNINNQNIVGTLDKISLLTFSEDHKTNILNWQQKTFCPQWWNNDPIAINYLPESLKLKYFNLPNPNTNYWIRSLCPPNVLEIHGNAVIELLLQHPVRFSGLKLIHDLGSDGYGYSIMMSKGEKENFESTPLNIGILDENHDYFNVFSASNADDYRNDQEIKIKLVFFDNLLQIFLNDQLVSTTKSGAFSGIKQFIGFDIGNGDELIIKTLNIYSENENGVKVIPISEYIQKPNFP
jgi:hypothetical protein